MDPVSGVSFYFKNQKMGAKQTAGLEVTSGSATPITGVPSEARVSRTAMNAFPPMTFGGPLNSTGDTFERRYSATKPSCPPGGQNCGGNPIMQFGQKAKELVRKKLFTLS
ncbi:MAG TPA: hypothetical protein V6C52_14530 [Coleofasciculaceae cyanobacterium]|jgi:hypothetical protein